MKATHLWKAAFDYADNVIIAEARTKGRDVVYIVADTVEEATAGAAAKAKDFYPDCQSTIVGVVRDESAAWVYVDDGSA